DRGPAALRSVAPGRYAVDDDQAGDRLIARRRERVGEPGAVAEAGEVERSGVGAAHERRRPVGVLQEDGARPGRERRELLLGGVGRYVVGAVVEAPCPDP